MAFLSAAGLRRVLIRPLRRLARVLVMAAIRRRFPEVPVIGCAPLAAELTGEAAAPVLIDARETEEFAVSHLAGVRRLATVEALEASGIGPGLPIVVYCSVGYRSARLARALRQVGYRDVSNLEGSLFRWANLGLPLEGATPGARRVHPFHPLWGLLLESTESAADSPPTGW